MASSCDPAVEDALPDVQPSAITVRLEIVAENLVYPLIPTDIVHAADGTGRLFVSGLGGVVAVIQPDGTLTQFLDTTNPNTDINPAHYGMMSIAFHPSFADDQSPGFGAFYTITTEATGAGTPDFGFGSDHEDVVYEWTVDPLIPDLADPMSRREILRVLQPAWDHNLFDLLFDQSQMLYITSGDGGNSPVYAPAAQDPSNVFGTILRIDPLGQVGTPSPNGNYSIPQTNPFVDMAGLDEIFAYGFRSPFRLTMDRATGELYEGDVGQVSIEEINRVVLGGNYGWDVKEGAFLFNTSGASVCIDSNPDPELMGPVAQWDHDDGRSVTGGFVYRGARIASLQGKMVAADFQGPGFEFQGRLFIVDIANGEVTELQIDPGGAQLPRLIFTIGEDEAGELYLGGSNQAGDVGVVLRIDRQQPAASCVSDVDDDGETTVEDVYAQWSSAIDADANGLTNLDDHRFVVECVRLDELASMLDE